jgi:hypothetical protein
MILDKKNDSYINKFTLHMLPPATEEDATRRDNQSSEIQLISDVMNLLQDIEDSSARLSILKLMLSNVISDA